MRAAFWRFIGRRLDAAGFWDTASRCFWRARRIEQRRRRRSYPFND